MYSSIKPHFDSEDYEKTKLSFLWLINEALLQIKSYRTAANADDYRIQQTLNYIDSAQNLIDCFDKEREFLFDIIKKQALILQTAGVVYPTINQSLGHIHDIYLQSKGRTSEIGHSDPINVEINII